MKTKKHKLNNISVGPVYPNKDKQNVGLKMPSWKEERRHLAFDKAKVMDVTLISLDCSTVKGKVFYVCNKCNISNEPKGNPLNHFCLMQEKPKCCANKMKQRAPGEALLVLLEKRNHELIGEAPESRRVKFIFKCKTHGKTFTTCWENYSKTKTGAICCGEKEGAKKRIIHGQSVDRPNPSWRVSSSMNKWRKEIRKHLPLICPVTGQTENLEVHHLYSCAAYPDYRFNLYNGIILSKKIHRKFHADYGWKTPITALNFIDFLESLKNESSLYNFENIEKTIQLVRQFDQKLTSSKDNPA